MTESRSIVSGKYLFTGVLALVAAALAILAPKSAVNVDEQLHYPHAKSVVNWYFTGGEDQSSLQTPQTNLKYYGQSVDNFTALVNRVFNVEDEFLVRHFTGAVFFLLLLLFTGLLSKEVTGSWTVAVITMLALVFMPRLAGQAFGNLKDIPFAAGYTAGILMIVRFVREMPHPRWKSALLLGAAIAFTVSVRAGGFILFAYLGLALLLYFVWKPFYFIEIVSTKPVFVRLLGQGTVILVTGYFAGLLFWPYALQNVWVHPLESLQVMEHYKVSIRQLFEGEMIWSTRLPWYYLPKWLAISTPVYVLAGFVVFAGFFISESLGARRNCRQMFLEGFVLFSFAFPFIYVIAIDSNLYSGVRQMLFILPPLALLSVWGIYKLLKLLAEKNRAVGYASSLIFVGALVWPVKHQAATFPADYVYFNSLTGGNRQAWGNYEYDYYFHSIKEAVDYLHELTAGDTVTVAMNSNLSNYFDNKPETNYIYTRFLERSSADWDYAIFGINYLEPHLLKDSRWKPLNAIKTFYHRGNPVAMVVERPDKLDFYGISEIKSGNLQQGIAFLEKAVEKQKNNVWLYVNLARAQLELGNEKEFFHYLEEGKKLLPDYEPLILLEANHYFREEKFEKTNAILNRLLIINPLYKPAKQMLEDVKKKMETDNRS